MKISFNTAALLFTTLIASTFSLDEKGAKETSCFETPPFEAFDLDWVGKVETWYFPFMSKLELYRTSSDLLKMKVEDIPESDLPYFCMTSSSKNEWSVDGLNKTGVPYKTEYTKTMRFWFMATDSPHAKSGIQTILYSDNKSFVIGVTCWEDVQQSWEIWSTRPTMTKENKKQAFKILKESGYNLDYMVEVKYDDKCRNMYHLLVSDDFKGTRRNDVEFVEIKHPHYRL